MDYEYRILGNYGSGWEVVTIESTPEDAEQMLRDYRDNEPQYSHTVRRVRV